MQRVTVRTIWALCFVSIAFVLCRLETTLGGCFHGCCLAHSCIDDVDKLEKGILTASEDRSGSPGDDTQAYQLTYIFALKYCMLSVTVPIVASQGHQSLNLHMLCCAVLSLVCVELCQYALHNAEQIGRHSDPATLCTPCISTMHWRGDLHQCQHGFTSTVVHWN